MSKYAKMDGLVEFVYELRQESVKWDAEGGIVDQVKANFPGYTTSSAIPLRNLYNAYLAKLDSGEAIRPTKGAIRKARTNGLGWHNIAGRAGITVAKAKKLAGADFEFSEGRVYVDQDGKVSTHKTDFSDRVKSEDDQPESDTEVTPLTEAEAATAEAIADEVEAATTASEEVVTA